MAANPPTAAQGEPAAAAAAAPATIFALTPGQHSPNVPLDFAKSDDIKLYKAGSKELGLKVVFIHSMWKCYNVVVSTIAPVNNSG